MKRTNKTEVKCTDFANTIYSIRVERNLTQKELGDLIGVSDRTISKWENGTTVPDLETIKRLCKELDTSPDSIIKSEKNFKDNLHSCKRKIGRFLNYILKNIFLIGFVIMFTLLLIYFINNYNTIKIYDFTYESENVSFKDGYFIKTKVLNIITINNINLNKITYEPTSTKVELYTYLNGDKHIIYESDKLDNIYLEESKSYTDLLTKDVIENIKNNLYIKIYTTDKDDNNYSYETKITLKQKLNNNKLCYKEYIKEQNKNIKDLGIKNPFLVPTTNEYENKDNNKPVVNNENKLESLEFTYDDKAGKYTKIDSDGGIIEYKISTNILKKSIIIDKIKYSCKYIVNKNIIICTNVRTNDELLMDFQYFVNTKTAKCLVGDCKNYQKEIDYILSVYADIMTIL